MTASSPSTPLQRVINIRCTGVPEHFNLPWRIIEEEKTLINKGITISWKDNPSGTGAMCNDLKDNDTDIAILLQEGAIKNIHEGMEAKMVSMYVDSPLIWGVHASSKSPLNQGNLEQPKFAISRYSSGSHIMAYCYGKSRNFKVNSENFEIIQNLDGARKSLPENLDQIFLWEKFTTKPFVDNGELKRIDEYPTPWAPFVIVVRQEFLQENEEAVYALLEEVQQQAAKLKNDQDTVNRIAKRYNILTKDALEWFNAVSWSQEIPINLNELESTSNVLLELGIIDRMPDLEKLIHQFKSRLEEKDLVSSIV